MGSSDELMIEARERERDQRVAEHLGLTLEEWEELQMELLEETSQDGATLSLYFEVPDEISDELAEKLGGSAGDAIYLPTSLFDEPEATDER